MNVSYLVVTRVAAPETGGNMGLVIPYLQMAEPSALNGWTGMNVPVTRIPSLALYTMLWRQPVFTMGEILIVDDDGREVAGARRKPDKWDVDVEGFDLVTQAIVRAQEIIDAPNEEAI